MFVAIITDAYSKIVEDENREEEEKRKEKGNNSSLRTLIQDIKLKIYFIMYPDKREPSISSAQLLDLLKSTRRKIPDGKKLTRYELAEFTGFQDLSEPVFNEIWAKLVTQKELNETELQPMGFGEANSEDEALEEHNAIKKEERDKLTSTRKSHEFEDDD